MGDEVDDILDGMGATAAPVAATAPPKETLLAGFLRVMRLDDRYRPVKKFTASPSKEVWIVSEGNQQYVAKVLNMELMSQNERRFAMNEVKCLSNCDHPNIIRYVADYEHEGTILLLMELAPAGDLSLQVHARARNRAFFKRNEALVVFAQLCLAMDYIHNKSMMHRDIKSENIFITTAGVLKLGDFGFTRQYDVTISGTPGGTFCGTPHYLSPEICTHQPYGKKSDLFSVGVVLYELLALERPFKGQNITEIMNNVVTGKFRPVLDINPEAGDDIAKLCHAMLALDPERRPSLQHIFATSLMRVALSDLRVAVAAMTKIPDTDRRAMREHIEALLGGTVCSSVRWATQLVGPLPNVAPNAELELFRSAVAIELRSACTVDAVVAGDTTGQGLLLGSMPLAQVQGIEVSPENPHAVTVRSAMGKWVVLLGSSREAAQCARALAAG
eukprot:PhM_4_TR10024/c4_g1_i5/m.94902/K08857/NEK1_4_5; NIMA (never in mitosis gene a)-related kinase 1/4/5